MSCPGLHCPGCGHGGALAAVGTIGAVALAAVAAWEILTALLWVILVITAAAVIAVSTAIVIGRRTTAPAQLGQLRPAAAISSAPPRAELEARLREAEINARAALLTAGIIAQQKRLVPFSGPHSNAERGIS
jgi:hypothetical protein